MAIAYKARGEYDYYGTRAERLADTEILKEKTITFYEYDTSKVYVATGTGWREHQQKVANKIVVSPIAQVLVSGKLLANDTVVGTRSVDLVDATGIVVGNVIKLEENGVNSKTFHAVIQSIAGNTLNIDRPMDKVYTAANAALKATRVNANVNGSVTPVIFTNENPFDQNVRINRMLFNMVLTDPPIFDGFGDIVGGLTNGIELRKKHADGTYTNYWNAKTNNRLSLLMFDTTFFDATLPINANGISGKFTFEKLGSYVELKQGEALEVVIQDNLTALETLEFVTEGVIEQG